MWGQCSRLCSPLPAPPHAGQGGGGSQQSSSGGGGPPHSGPLVRTCSKGGAAQVPSAGVDRLFGSRGALPRTVGRLVPGWGVPKRPPSLVPVHEGRGAQRAKANCVKKGATESQRSQVGGGGGPPQAWSAPQAASQGRLVGEGAARQPLLKALRTEQPPAEGPLPEFLRVLGVTPPPPPRPSPRCCRGGPDGDPSPSFPQSPCWAGREGLGARALGRPRPLQPQARAPSSPHPRQEATARGAPGVQRGRVCRPGRGSCAGAAGAELRLMKDEIPLPALSRGPRGGRAP